MEIPENLHKGGNSLARRVGLLPSLGQLVFFEGGFRRTKCPVDAQTQVYHLVCIWGSLVQFLHSYAVFCAVCMQAMTHSVDNVPSQQAVEPVVVGLGFVEQCWLRLFLGDQLQLKMG